jgi:hypothetical protein
LGECTKIGRTRTEKWAVGFPGLEAAPAKPEILNLGPPRNGKIAKLAKDLRTLLNQMLSDGATSAVIIEQFARRGISLNHENISNWRHGGYQDWILEQQWLEEISAQRESASALLDGADDATFQQAVIQLAVAQIFHTLKKGKLNDDPSNYTRLLNALSRLAREALVMRKYRDLCAKEKLLQPKSLDPKRELTDNDHLLFYAKVEELFHLKPGDLAAAAKALQSQSPPTQQPTGTSPPNPSTTTHPWIT